MLIRGLNPQKNYVIRFKGRGVAGSIKINDHYAAPGTFHVTSSISNSWKEYSFIVTGSNHIYLSSSGPDQIFIDDIEVIEQVPIAYDNFETMGTGLTGSYRLVNSSNAPPTVLSFSSPNFCEILYNSTSNITRSNLDPHNTYLLQYYQAGKWGAQIEVLKNGTWGKLQTIILMDNSWKRQSILLQNVEGVRLKMDLASVSGHNTGLYIDNFEVYQINTIPNEIKYFYRPGVLTKTVFEDPDGITSRVFKNKAGNVLLSEKQLANGDWNQTYYVYDDRSRLRFVIQPEAVKRILEQNETSAEPYLYDYLFEYQYNGLDQLVYSKIPGAEPVISIYDIIGRLRAQQDGVMKEQRRWKFYKYDQLNRPVMTGIHSCPEENSDLKIGFPDDPKLEYAVVETDGTSFKSTRESEVIDEPKFENGGSVKTLKSAGSIAPPSFVDVPYPSHTPCDIDHMKNELNNANELSESFDPTLNLNALYYGYSNQSFPTQDFKVQQYDFYDGYEYQTLNFATNSDFKADASFGNNPSFRTKGLSVASLSRAINQSSSMWTYSVSYYNEKGALIQTQYSDLVSSLSPNSPPVDMIYWEHNKYRFDGQVDRFGYFFQYPGTTLKKFTLLNVYSGRGQFIRSILSMPQSSPHFLGSRRTPLEVEYNRINQTIREKIGGWVGYANTSNFIQTNDIYYNERGWITAVNNVERLNGDLFAYELNYENPDWISGGTATFNGNISEVAWTSATNTSGRVHAYSYSYDNLNRLTQARYSAFDPASRDTYYPNDVDLYSLTNLSYDANGNILTANRNGWLFNKQSDSFFKGTALDAMDALQYTYDGNRLTAVTDNRTGTYDGYYDYQANTTTGNGYEYDANGNMTFDENRGLRIEYNQHNLPKRIWNDEGQINFIYTHDGTLHKKIFQIYGSAPQYKYYYGPFECEYGSPSNDFDYVYFPDFRLGKGGYRSNELYHLEYFHKDHLGNVRITYGDANDNNVAEMHEILEENEYYPFGMTFGKPNSISGTQNPYKYNQKELMVELEINMYNYGARYFMPEIGRFSTIDPMSHNYNFQTPYAYAGNNPILFRDEFGLCFGCSVWDDLVEYAKEELAEAVNDAIVSTLEATAEYINQKRDNLEAGLYLEGGIKVTSGASFSIDAKGFEGTVDLGTAELLEVSIDERSTDNEGDSPVNVDYYGKDDEVETTQGGGASFVVGGSYEKTTTSKIGTRNSEVVSTSETYAAKGGGLGAAGVLKYTTGSAENSEVKTGGEFGFGFNFFVVGFSVNLGIGTFINYNEDD
ncbi:MAG TPA: hypothetical protein DDX92_12715 [Flavobacteriales bacterium]|jgi:RHS repeat-associated protein|nr:hypothetical protein [Flavobacteriales bacterium]